MATKTIFVSLYRHLDPETPVPSGARRDATASWAHFANTTDGLLARHWCK